LKANEPSGKGLVVRWRQPAVLSAG